MNEERPHGWRDGDDRDYREFMRQYAVGAQSIKDLGLARVLGLVARAGEALREVLRGVESQDSRPIPRLRAGLAHGVGAVLGVVLALVRLPIVAMSRRLTGAGAVLIVGLFLAGAVVTIGGLLGAESIAGRFSALFPLLMLPFLLYPVVRSGLLAVRPDDDDEEG